jgi:hypothetical protein
MVDPIALVRLWSASAALLAAAPAVSHGAPPPGTAVGEIVVVAGPGPRVVASFPAEGSEISAGTLVLKVVFDQPMAADAWSYGPAEGRAFPRCLERPRLLANKRTSVLLCAVAAHLDYAIQINPTPQFASADGRSARPIVLRFKTGDVEVRGLAEALSRAGLTAADQPIMRWRDSGAGAAHSPPASDPPDR